MALGTNIRCLSDAALGVLSPNNSAATGQIAAITAEQIAVLSPAQVRMLGATGDGGATTTSKLSNLKTGAWAALAASMAQVAAITAAEVRILSPGQNDAGIAHLSMGAFASLSAAQIAVLTTAQKASLSAAQHTSCAC